ncbi:MAG: hypothetical protein ACKOT0_02585 [bacterium]
MTSPSAERFYSIADDPPQQGDILIGAVTRVIAEDEFTPPRWEMLDEHRATLAPAQRAGHVTVPALQVAGGRGLVMVCSHDCGLDKEFNAVVNRLMDPAGANPRGEDQAVAEAEAREDLDRSFTVSPLVRPEDVTVAGEPVDRALLMAGRVIGYLPVPPLVVEGREVIPESVVDLAYRATIDRFAYTQRITSISEEARERLRFALARLDILRTPTLEAQLAYAVGQEITSARVSRENPLVVELILGDGSKIELLVKPGSPRPSTRARRHAAP